MTYAESSGHVTDDVTWPQKVNVVTAMYKVLCLHSSGKQVDYSWPTTRDEENIIFCNKTANINVQNISLYAC